MELPVYFSLQFDTKEKATSIALRDVPIHVMSLQLVILQITRPIFFLHFLNRKNKQMAFKTEYYPFTWFLHKLFLEDKKKKQLIYINTAYKINTMEKTDFGGGGILNPE